MKNQKREYEFTLRYTVLVLSEDGLLKRPIQKHFDSREFLFPSSFDTQEAAKNAIVETDIANEYIILPVMEWSYNTSK